jgi:adenylate cyclase
MPELRSRFDYQVGGSLDSHAPSYVMRHADTLFYETLKAGQFCYVLNSRQMGKSSLRVRAMQRLQDEGMVCVFIDLTGMGTQDVTSEKWYAGIVQCLVSSCELGQKIDWRGWWREHRDLLSPVQRLRLFIEEVLLLKVQQRIIIFVDEIDRVLSQTFPLDDFFALIRSFALQNGTREKRITFALLGVATPSYLIQDKTQTPFNIGQAIELQGFQLHEAHGLTEGLKGKVERPEAVMREILSWTGGQPFLTQKLCRLAIQCLDRGEFLERERTESKKYLKHQSDQYQQDKWEAIFIAQVVKSQILDNWEAQDEPEHLKTIQNRLLRSENHSGRILGLYQSILQTGAIATDASPEQMELRLSGIVVERQGTLVVHNQIYQAIFSNAWVERKLVEQRPYARLIAAWFTSARQDNTYLLRGQALQDTLTWTLGKSLSNDDYQYILASQDLERRQAQDELESTTLASRLLASARQEAQAALETQRPKWAWIPKAALVVTLVILGVRWSGVMQNSEWSLLDQFFRWRPLESPDPRIAIITIDEQDLKQVGQWPIPDRVLAQALTTLKAQQPQSIGLDLYRDLTVEPGHGELVKLLKSTPNLFGVEKVIKPQIAASPTLQQQGQVGFADQIVDADGKVRRALLTVDLADNDLRQSLATTLTLHYLTAKGIEIEQLPGYQIRLGKAVFQRFEPNDGGYVRAESGGYQILLNYRRTEANFMTYPLRDLLNHKIPPNTLRDCLVLMGTTAESLNDFFYTPYSDGLFSAPVRVSGVMLHANIASSLLSAAQDGRSPLRVWSKPLEWVWILGWASVGAAIGLRFKGSVRFGLGVLLSIVGLGSICYAAFLGSWWLPGVPPLFALLGAAALVRWIQVRQRDQLLFNDTFSKLLSMGRDYPIASRIALEYFKQSEGKERQAMIEQHLRKTLTGETPATERQATAKELTERQTNS